MSGYVILKEEVLKLIGSNVIEALQPNGAIVNFNGAHKYLAELTDISKPVYASLEANLGAGLNHFTLVGVPFRTDNEVRAVGITFVVFVSPNSILGISIATNNTLPNELSIHARSLNVT